MTEKKRKLLWWDEGRPKTARGSHVDIEKDESGGILIIFHGYEGDIILTPHSYGGSWSVS